MHIIFKHLLVNFIENFPEFQILALNTTEVLQDTVNNVTLFVSFQV
jgi:hypothetical protein